MRNRLWWVASLVIGLVIPLTGCGNPSGLDSIQVSPTSQSLGVGQTSQLSVSGTYGNSSHLATKAVTGGVSWSSNTPAVATVSGSGMVTAVGAGTATIVASATGFSGPVSSSATITVTAASGGSGGTASGAVASIAITPGAQSVAPTQTTQFIAIGTTSSGATEDLTGQVTWSSSAQQIATIGATTGLATAVTPGTVTITALYSAGGGASVIGTATFTVTGTASEEAFTSLTITPGSQSLSASGQTGQFIAIATNGSGLQENVSSSSALTWTSSMPSVATISASGLATGVSVGTTTIIGQLTNQDNSIVTATATINVALTSPPESILSLSIIPSSITVLNLQGTGQFLAIGTFSTPPYVRDVTNTSTWLSSAPNIFPVSSNSTDSGSQGKENAGVATAFGSGSATIIAEYIADELGTVQLATATFNCPMAEANPNGDPPEPATCLPGTEAPSLLSTLTVYNMGLNTTNWQVTAPSATGTPNVLHCGPGWSLGGGAGGSVCTATYPVGTTITLTATQPAGATGTFGGWSSNCQTINPDPSTATGSNTCTVKLNEDDTVGAIFN
jgi:uncharacterized protein YjdB